MSEEHGRIWFVFGRYPDGLHVDIASSENSTLFERLPMELAKAICREHNRHIEELAHKLYEERIQSIGDGA